MLEWQIYKSERFVINGNISWRVVITDLHEDKAYEIAHSDLVKFRRHFDNIKPQNKDILILTTIASKKGKAA